MSYATEQATSEGPATLQAVMREAVGAGLRSRYKPEKEIPHELMVLLMQMKENQRPRKNA